LFAFDTTSILLSPLWTCHKKKKMYYSIVVNKYEIFCLLWNNYKYLYVYNILIYIYVSMYVYKYNTFMFLVGVNKLYCTVKMYVNN